MDEHAEAEKNPTLVHKLQHAVIDLIDEKTSPKHRAVSQNLIEAAMKEYFADDRITKSITKEEFEQFRAHPNLDACHALVDRLTDAVTDQALTKNN